ncbi:precorrin-6y C5,15-methyltransferase (decarboxylating) subunit CbiE [Rhodococcus sp. USK10]|uniref:precorrin-6y C5,15-methyltransferase (decarboxylating) subunit CbiE n=1 Tax=Rhodococcus sp. USK10 TaxID=2789739 RepID=UPI001C6020A5|nr:precorrin-6y C5,15-methyltransferase (decarboxylating) subunit CbiE [Rhodococcus sp. USK10]QYB04884.1 precorrin-6y C5,15-methyltransferase (decarboxylating) subunit CbiE [Rhodococcus sp. USK10]
MTDPIVVVGIGADGWDGLSPSARRAIETADVVMGSGRQLALIPESPAVRVAWPSPLVPALPGLFEQHHGRRVCVLASGDPMFHGIGVTLVDLLGADRVRVIPHPSSATLACARLGWAAHDTPVVSLVNRPVDTLVPALGDRTRLLVLSRDEHTPAAVAELLTERGFGPSRLTVLGELGGPDESRLDGTASAWSHEPGPRLNVIAIDCRAESGALRLTRLPGLPDAAFTGDGQMTKHEVRALTLCALAPAAGEVLWDVGGGSGTIAIEWMRTHPLCRAVTFERSAARVDQITSNAAALGVPSLAVFGDAPVAFGDVPADLSAPDAIFVGGGVTQDGLLDECWSRLRVGGRMVANAVTAESEALLLQWFSHCGGQLRKFQVYRGEPLGGFTAWRPQLPVAQWSVTKQSKGVVA